MNTIKKYLPDAVICFALAIAVYFAVGFLNQDIPKPGSEVIPGVGAVIDSGTGANTITIRQGGGTLTNRGAATVYLAWNTTTAPAADTAAAVGKCYLAQDQSVPIPVKVTTIVHLTASGSAKLIYTEQ